MSVTLVSAVVDLTNHGAPGRRPVEWYLDNLDPLLSTRHALVLHCEPRVMATIAERRARLAPDAPMRLVPTTFESLPTAHFEPTIAGHLDEGRRPESASDPVKDSAAYLALGWAKPALLAEAHQHDHGTSERYWWIDAHLATVAPTPPSVDRDDLLARPRGALHADVLWETSADEYADRAHFHRTNPFSRVAGGLFSVTPAMARRFADTMTEEIDACLDGGWPTIDEALLGIVVDRLRADATLSYGPWEALISDIDGPLVAPWHRMRLLRDCRTRGLFDRAYVHARALLEAHGSGVPLSPEELFGVHDDLLIIAAELGERSEFERSYDELGRMLRDGASDPEWLTDEERARVEGNLSLAAGLLGRGSDPAQDPQ